MANLIGRILSGAGKATTGLGTFARRTWSQLKGGPAKYTLRPGESFPGVGNEASIDAINARRPNKDLPPLTLSGVNSLGSATGPTLPLPAKRPSALNRFGPAALTATGVGVGAGGVAHEVAAQHARDAAAGSNPAPGSTPASNAQASGSLDKGLGGVKNYFSGFAQSPMKWGAGQWAGGIGASAVLAYLLANHGNSEKSEDESD